MHTQVVELDYHLKNVKSRIILMKKRNCPNHRYQFYENWKWENLQFGQQAKNILNVSFIAVATGKKTLRREDLEASVAYILTS